MCIGNGLHGLGNEPNVLGNGPNLLGIMSQFRIMLHSGLCHIGDYVVQHYVVRHYVAFGVMLFNIMQGWAWAMGNGHAFFSKERKVLGFFCVLYKRTRRS